MRRGASTGLGKPVNHRAQPTTLTCNYRTAVIRAHCQDPEWCLAWEGDQKKVVREREHVHLHCDHLLPWLLPFMAPFPLACGFAVLSQTYWPNLVSLQPPALSLSHPKPLLQKNWPIALWLKAIESKPGSITCDPATGSFVSALSWSRDLFRFGEHRVQFKLVLLMSGSLIENATSNVLRVSETEWVYTREMEEEEKVVGQAQRRTTKKYRAKLSAWQMNFLDLSVTFQAVFYQSQAYSLKNHSKTKL